MNSGSVWSQWSRNLRAIRPKSTCAAQTRGAQPRRRAWSSRPLCKSSGRAASGRRYRLSALAVQAPCTANSCNGPRRASSRRCGRRVWPSTTNSKALPGVGKVSTRRFSRHHWRKRPSAPILRIGGKNGSKRHLPVDGRGVPLSLVVTGANAHDVTQIEAVRDAIVVKRPAPK